MGKIEYNFDNSILIHVPEDFVGELEIPEGVIEIGKCALIDCTELTAVNFPTTLKVIGDSAFKRCTNLVLVDIPSSVEKIGSGAFCGCHSLESVVLPDKLSVLESDVFSETSIEYIVIPDLLKKIENGAFKDCYYLQTIQLPKGIIIEDGAFEGCSGMIQADALYLNLYDNPHYKLIKVHAYAKNYVIPDDVVEIGSYVFAENTKIGSLVIPNSVQIIHESAFRNCEGLEAVIIGEGVTELGEYSFKDCKSLKEVTILSSIKKMPKGCFSGCDSLSSVVMPESVEIIDTSCFERCTNMINISLPKYLNIVGAKAFRDCVNLKSVEFKETLQKIDDAAFSNCTSLKFARLPESLCRIGVSCFENCISLSQCSLSSNISSVPYRAFAGCKSLNEIILPQTLEVIEDKAFIGCSELAIKDINRSVKIGQDAFRGTEICDEHLLPRFKYYGKILPSQWESDTPSGKTKIRVYRGFYVNDIESAKRVIEDIKQNGLYLEQITDIFPQKYLYKESRGHEKLDRNNLDVMYEDMNVLSHVYHNNNQEYVYFGDYVCAMNYALRGSMETIPIVIEAEIELDKLNVDGVDSLDFFFNPESNNALVCQIFGEKINMYYEKYRAETIDADDETAMKIRKTICDMAKSDNDIVYSFYKNSKCIFGKAGNRFKSAFQAKLPIESSRITSVKIVSKDFEFPQIGISLSDFR